MNFEQLNRIGTINKVNTKVKHKSFDLMEKSQPKSNVIKNIILISAVSFMEIIIFGQQKSNVKKI